MGRMGSVRVNVFVDRQLRYASPELTGGQDPVRFRVPLVGAQELVLRIEFGENGSIGDHVDFVDTLLILPARGG
jgi:hypothetical protein